MPIQGAVRIVLIAVGVFVLAPWSVAETEEHSWFSAHCYDGPAWRPGLGPISVLCLVVDSGDPYPGDADPDPDERSSPECADSILVAFTGVSQSGSVTVVPYEISECDPPPPAASRESSESLGGATASSPTPKAKAAAGILFRQRLRGRRIESTD